MKIWTSDHVFDHPWETVVHAAFRKYPNPMNKAITAIDVVRQEVDEGVIKSERLLQSKFHIPSWVSSLTGFKGTQCSFEYTEIDPANRSMTLTTRNFYKINCVYKLLLPEDTIKNTTQNKSLFLSTSSHKLGVNP
ncbi:PRELI-like family protein [Aphelenchoides bicaudatus]|nr:PRELI-like family protein [Aphelenchoides bicaudatus]